jgi:hypothetical protein
MTWQDAWREGRTRWDAGESPPILRRLVRRGELPTGIALVPGCGSGYDVFTLAAEDRRVIGIDIAPGAAERFEALREERGIPASEAHIHVGDFFAFELDDKADLCWDYTFFCAIEPERRREWGAKVDSLLAPEAELLTLVFPTDDIHDRDGPPYTMSIDLYQSALGPKWKPHVVREVEESHSGREGLEKLVRWKRA